MKEIIFCNIRTTLIAFIGLAILIVMSLALVDKKITIEVFTAVLSAVALFLTSVLGLFAKDGQSAKERKEEAVDYKEIAEQK